MDVVVVPFLTLEFIIGEELLAQTVVQNEECRFLTRKSLHHRAKRESGPITITQGS